MSYYVAYLKSPVGLLKLEADDDALLGISFISNNDQVENINSILELTIIQLQEYFAHKRQYFKIPLKFTNGTKFQQETWNALILIPYGCVISYKELAYKINKSGAYRAVGNANNKNPFVIIIPCHRVIGSNGLLVGYRGGIDNKQWLLNHEIK